MEIANEQLEWAVVDRLGRLMRGQTNHDCPVTYSFALFVSLIIWVRQHVAQYEDNEWPTTLRRLREPIHGDFWGLRRGRSRGNATLALYRNGARADVDLESCTAWEFIVWIRHTMAHGDARCIYPFHAQSLPADRRLIGFVFERDHCRISLTASDMRIVGARIAETFTSALSRGEVEDNDVKRFFSEALAD